MKNMKKLFRRNQIIITTLAIMIAAAGYLNYAGKQELVSGDQVFEAGMMDISDEDILAENQLMAEGPLTEIVSPEEGMDDVDQVGNTADIEEAQEQVSSDVAAGEPEQLASAEGEETGDDSQAGMENPGEAVLTSGMNVSEYIAGVQLSREQVRARNKETLNEIINNEAIDQAAKQQAIQNLVRMTEVSEKENAAETLLMAKGFADPVVSITDGKVDVVINAAQITDPQRAQIEDIVKRKAEVGAENIVITLLNTQE
ncbi:SpoIIIAH-like family protein [Lachnoclostridium edouardi]|uniref:SpoIIIAH-like family protein n=1 Tax=Lachnoclostridium edouardi TaxID=1926283 RepID=UPI002E8E2548|nr:SpoIIIAH-like family protein [Lachnoclostridium edouardi]